MSGVEYRHLKRAGEARKDALELSPPPRREKTVCSSLNWVLGSWPSFVMQQAICVSKNDVVVALLMDFSQIR